MRNEKTNCEKCGQEFVKKHSKHKFCSFKCQQDVHEMKRRMAVKPVICESCGASFRRKAAKQVKCQACRDKMKLGDKLSVNYVNYPQMSREREVELINEWLEKNEVQVC